MELNAKTLAASITALIITVVLTLSILVPVTSTISDEQLTYTNVGTSFAEPDSGTHIITYSVDDAGNTTIDCDGHAVALPKYATYLAVYSPSGFIYYSNGTNNNLYYVSGSAVTNLGSATDGLTITIADGTATFGAFTLPNVAAYISDSGKYCLTDNAHIIEDTSVIFEGSAAISSSVTVNVYGSGTVDTLAVSAVRPTSQTIGQITPTTSEVRSDLMTLDNVTVTITANGTTGDATYDTFLVEKKVEFTNPNYNDGAEGALVGIIPLLVLVGVILGTIALFINRD